MYQTNEEAEYLEGAAAQAEAEANIEALAHHTPRREIKFRAWHEDRKTMYYNVGILWNVTVLDTVPEQENTIGLPRMQYTGLKAVGFLMTQWHATKVEDLTPLGAYKK